MNKTEDEIEEEIADLVGMITKPVCECDYCTGKIRHLRLDCYTS